MMWLLWLALLIYAVWLSILARQFSNRSKMRGKINNPEIRFTIVIPFRNEYKHLPELMDSLKKLNYPPELTEVIFSDDHSDDKGPEWLKTVLAHLPFPAKLIHADPQNEGKKMAITKAVRAAAGNYVLTTDADCTLPSDILGNLNDQIVKNHDYMIAGPVVYLQTKSGSISDDFQIIENAGLVVIGAWAISQGKPVMANGANLCFKKSVFEEVGGYSGNFHIPGGDDEFLMEKIHQNYPGRISFLYRQEALVETLVQPDWASMINQRTRWASKGRLKKDKTVFVIQTCIILLFMALVVQVIHMGIRLHFLTSLQLLGIKALADLYFYSTIQPFFRLKIPLTRVLLVSLIQPFIAIRIAVTALAGTYTWKKRVYKI